MNNKVSGINEEKLENLIQRVMNNVEQLEKRFEQLDSVVYEMKNYYKGDSSVVFKSSYDSLRYNYKIVRNNIMSYVNDLSRVKSKYRDFTLLASSDFNSIEKL